MTDIINYLIYITSTLFTYILGLISKKHKWNEELPIPIQNILIGLIVFVFAYVFCLITKIELNSQEILKQILFSMGGAGTATLGYDTTKINKEDKI